MVSESGQLYTMEGVAAAILMIVTAYLVMSTTSVLTQQDVHITDMQLEQLGNDALAMMDTPITFGNETNRTQSNLSIAIATGDNVTFNKDFLQYLTANTSGIPGIDTYAYNATIYYRTQDTIKPRTFYATPYYRENAVKVSRWVYLPNGTTPNGTTTWIPDLNDNKPHSVILEVLLWRE